LLAISIFKPSDHEQVSESPTESIQSDILTENRLARAEAYSAKAYSKKESVEVGEPAEVAPTESEKAAEPPKPPTISVIATHYTASCEGCIGITKNGTDVRQTIYSGGKRIIAVDPDVIPLNSTVQVTYEDGTTFKAIAADVGASIKNKRIDVLVASESEAFRLGRQRATVTILEGGI